MWQKEQDVRKKSTDSRDVILELRGCDKHEVQACHRHNKTPNYIMCSSLKYPEGMEAW